MAVGFIDSHFLSAGSFSRIGINSGFHGISKAFVIYYKNTLAKLNKML